MAVLKHTSPTAWPGAPRPKPSSTVPSASTRSAVVVVSLQPLLACSTSIKSLDRPFDGLRQNGDVRGHAGGRLWNDVARSPPVRHRRGRPKFPAHQGFFLIWNLACARAAVRVSGAVSAIR